MNVSDFDFDLPEELIAQEPASERDRSRLLVVDRRAGTLEDTSWLRPVAHFYVKSAQTWEVFGGNVACYEAAPEDFAAIGLAWRKMMAQGGDQ